MDQIKFSDFQKLDIRIGTVVEAVVPEWSHWVIKLTVDLGPETGKRTIFAGIMKFFKPEDLIGKQFQFVTNIEPKKIGPEGDYSEGMMMAAVPSEVEGEEKPILISPLEKLDNGSRVM